MIKKQPNGKFRARIFSSGIQIASKVFDHKRDAEAWEQEQKRQLLVGQWIDPRAGTVPLGTVIADFLAEHKGATNPKTWDTTESNLRLHVPERLKRLPIRTVSVGNLESAYMTALKEPLARSTVNRVRNDLSIVFAWAARQEIITENTVTKSRVPAGGIRAKIAVAPFSEAELRVTLSAQAAANEQYAKITEFVSLTGLRWGELVALRVRDFVAEPMPSIVVSRSASDGYDIKRTKSNRARRVPLIDRAEEILIERLPGKGSNDLIFTSATGMRLNGGNFKRATRWESTASGHRFHDLRHTAATNWLQSGIDIKTVAQWLGHSNPTITLTVYAHYLGEASDLAALTMLRR